MPSKTVSSLAAAVAALCFAQSSLAGNVLDERLLKANNSLTLSLNYGDVTASIDGTDVDGVEESMPGFSIQASLQRGVYLSGEVTYSDSTLLDSVQTIVVDAYTGEKLFDLQASVLDVRGKVGLAFIPHYRVQFIPYLSVGYGSWQFYYLDFTHFDVGGGLLAQLSFNPFILNVEAGYAKMVHAKLDALRQDMSWIEERQTRSFKVFADIPFGDDGQHRVSFGVSLKDATYGDDFDSEITFEHQSVFVGYGFAF